MAHSMKKITNKKRIDGYLKKYSEFSFLKKYPLHLYQFDENEILNEKLNPKQFLLFLVDGTCQITTVSQDGRIHSITRISVFTCFGDMELADDSMRQHEIKTITECEFLAIDLIENKNKVLNDPKLLYFLLKSIAQKMLSSSQAQSETTNVESRILYYLQEHNTIHGVNVLTQSIHSSRRQVQRGLKKLCEENKIKKIKKGTYEKV